MLLIKDVYDRKHIVENHIKPTNQSRLPGQYLTNKTWALGQYASLRTGWSD